MGLIVACGAAQSPAKVVAVTQPAKVVARTQRASVPHALLEDVERDGARLLCGAELDARLQWLVRDLHMRVPLLQSDARDFGCTELTCAYPAISEWDASYRWEFSEHEGRLRLDAIIALPTESAAPSVHEAAARFVDEARGHLVEPCVP